MEPTNFAARRVPGLPSGAVASDPPLDLTLRPINGRDEEREAKGIVGNIDAREAAQLAHEIGASAAVPLHWDMFAGRDGEIRARLEKYLPNLRVVWNDERMSVYEVLRYP